MTDSSKENPKFQKTTDMDLVKLKENLDALIPDRENNVMSILMRRSFLSIKDNSK